MLRPILNIVRGLRASFDHSHYKYAVSVRYAVLRVIHASTVWLMAS